MRACTNLTVSRSEHCTFDASGKYLCFVASTDAGPVRQWFAMSNADIQATNNLYLAVLQKGVASPFKAQSDEEKVQEPAVRPGAP